MVENILKENQYFDDDERSQFVMVNKNELKRLYIKIEEYQKLVHKYESQYTISLGTVEKYRE